MSLQEAASSGSFNPRAAQPIDPQRAESPFQPTAVDENVDQAMAEPISSLDHPFDFPGAVDEALAEGGEPDMRTTRRRAWTVIGLAIVIPAAVAGIIAWQLFGSDAEPVPTVTRVTTTPAESVTRSVATATPTPVEASVAATTATPASTTETTTEVSAATTATDAPAASVETAATASAATETAADLASLDPVSRLAAWTDLETIQVLPGETLWLIAQNYSTTISAIVTLNGINDPEALSIGQELVIPVGFAEEIVETTGVASVESESSAAADGSEAITVIVAGSEGTALTDDLASWHTIAPVLVENGDSLDAIAAANDTSVGAIMALNGLSDPNLIFIGVELLVPVGYQGDVPVPEVAVVQISSDSSAASVDSAASGEENSATEDLMEEQGAGAGGSDNEDMLEE